MCWHEKFERDSVQLTAVSCRINFSVVVQSASFKMKRFSLNNFGTNYRTYKQIHKDHFRLGTLLNDGTP